jgi:hypothetical protein
MSSAINSDQLLASMATAAARALQQRWPTVRDYAETEFRKFLIQAEHIKKLKSEDRINEDKAKLLMDLQRNAMRSVLLSLEGLGILAAEAAINAALGVIRDAVNKAMGGGWKVL